MKKILISLKELEESYNKAVKQKKEVFDLHGYKFFVPYAKYLIEYLTDLYRKNNVPKTRKIPFSVEDKADENNRLI